MTCRRRLRHPSPLFQSLVMEAAESRRARLLALRADAQKVRIQQNEPLATPSEYVTSDA